MLSRSGALDLCQLCVCPPPPRPGETDRHPPPPQSEPGRCQRPTRPFAWPGAARPCSPLSVPAPAPAPLPRWPASREPPRETPSDRLTGASLIRATKTGPAGGFGGLLCESTLRSSRRCDPPDADSPTHRGAWNAPRSSSRQQGTRYWVSLAGEPSPEIQSSSHRADRIITSHSVIAALP